MLQTNLRSRRRGPRPTVGLFVFCMAVAFVLSGCVRTEDGAGLDGTLSATTTTTTAPPDIIVPPPDDSVPPPVDPDPPIDPPPVTDIAAFQQFLHPILTDPNNFCAGCHGAAQVPTFAVADVDLAYNVIVSQQKVDLDNPDLSRLYVRPAVERHNCGGDAICDAIAADILAGIQAWAANAPPPDPTMQTLMSSTTSFANGVLAGLTRAESNVIAKFTFDEGAGDVTVDSSGVGNPITLQIEGMEWIEGGLRNVSGKAQASAADSRKLFDMITPVDEYTIEAWIIPENDAQDGPARVVSYSQDTAVRNFTVGQNAIYYQLRNRTAASNANGTPALEQLNPQVATSLTHVVMTFEPVAGRKIYINGQLSIDEDQAATLDWRDDQLFVIGNEVTNDRLWQGIFQMVAVHNTALTPAEVQQNFDAGAGNIITLRFDLANILAAPGVIEMQAAELDQYSYVFGRPVFVSDVTGVRVKNMRIAVNGSAPVAAQAFRRVDTTVLQSGTLLSPLGAVIPAELGTDNDQFQLEFEILGGQFGLAESVGPPTPPVPLPDSPEPDLGMRTFSQVNDTMSTLTGISANAPAVQTRYSELRDSLPATFDLLAFAAAQQIAIQRLATTYCAEIVSDNGTCAGFFGSCDIAANAKDQVADTLYDRLIGDNIATQPARANVTTEVVRMIDDLGCANGCSGAVSETALNATCAAVLASGAITVN
ncbi:MAG: LamG domain-containing protein [Gammaproteobacteria bacterium]